MRPIRPTEAPFSHPASHILRLPVYATQLVEELDRSTPPRCIRPGESLEDAHRYAGKRELIESLLQRLRATVESDPTKPVL